ncbi:MAG: hypothetical protein KAI25_08625, partial [Hyphomicrobiaceae bacterium]|nr:hypothetical protein [Hyphomicrobiaceae bacterium]
MCNWLATRNCPTAWLSLDENDNDLRWFLNYLVEAVRSAFPEACADTVGMLNAEDMPAPRNVAATLVNELDGIGAELVVALDDYHVIREPAVHVLLSELLRHPSPAFHLALATRHDPPLPLTSLRARVQVTEIRAQDLRFNAEESAAFIQNVLSMPVDETTVAVLEKKSEGWAAGLRMAAMSMRHQDDPGEFVPRLKTDNRFVMEYLVEEVLSQQPPHIQERLLTTSIFDRFCGPMCRAIHSPDAGSSADDNVGEDFVSFVERANLFVIPLDDQREWYRYHSLFQKLLQRQLRQRKSEEEISALHAGAAAWFALEGLIEEALHHLLKSGDSKGAAQFVAECRNDVMNREQWHLLKRWLGLLPRDAIENNPGLLMLEAWTVIGWPEMAAPIQRAGEL